MKVKSESEVAQSCPTLSDPWTAAHQAPPSMGFSRQECWSGVPLPCPLKNHGPMQNPTLKTIGHMGRQSTKGEILKISVPL